MKTVEVPDRTYDALAVAARVTGTTLGQVIEKLVAEAGRPSTQSGPPSANGDAVPVYALYNGVRTEAVYVPSTGRVEVLSGPLSGMRYKTPSAAARAVVASEKPEVNSNRNGWGFWQLTSNGQALQSIRPTS